MKIKGITLLSDKEYKKYRFDIKPNIKPIVNWWWLRSPGRVSNYAAFVDPDGIVCGHGSRVDNSRICVRPALVIEDAPPVGRSFIFGDVSWTVISSRLALADWPFRVMAFRKDWRADDANVYEASDIKPYLDCWLAGLEEEA